MPVIYDCARMQSLCFPTACCLEEICQDTDSPPSVGDWVFQEFISNFDARCASGESIFCVSVSHCCLCLRAARVLNTREVLYRRILKF